MKRDSSRREKETLRAVALRPSQRKHRKRDFHFPWDFSNLFGISGLPLSRDSSAVPIKTIAKNTTEKRIARSDATLPETAVAKTTFRARSYFSRSRAEAKIYAFAYAFLV
jgi:hypothetical protein